MKKQCGIFLLAAALALSPFASSALAAGKSGDVDLDSEITCKDVVLLTDYVLSNASLTDVQFCNSDLTSDGKLNAFDLAALKRYSSALPPQGDVLEPKGTVHSGYATYYDGGYEGGCAMLDPISKEDYWITAMNVFDYMTYTYPAKVKAGYGCQEYRSFLTYANPIVEERNSSAKKLAKFKAGKTLQDALN